MMDENKIKRRKAVKTKILTIRVSPGMSTWLSENNYSPTGILHEACKELGYKGE